MLVVEGGVGIRLAQLGWKPVGEAVKWFLSRKKAAMLGVGSANLR